MALFVSFQDDSTDPTFTAADDAVLVESRYEYVDNADNPCVGRSVRRTAPVAPRTADEIEAFAAVMGWSVETDNDGNLVLYPGVSAEYGDDEDADI